MEELLIPLVYIILLIGSMIKGEAFLITAILASERGYIDFPLVIAVALVGTIASDHLFYFVGRNKSRDVLWKRPGMIDFAESLYEKLKLHPLRVFLSHQFLNGFTQRIPYLTGTSNLKPLAFTAYDVISSLIWIAALVTSALLLDTLLGEAFAETCHYELGLLVGILVAGLLIQLFIHVRRERNNPVQSDVVRRV